MITVYVVGAAMTFAHALYVFIEDDGEDYGTKVLVALAIAALWPVMWAIKVCNGSIK